jgi:hypothetical protein
MRGDVSPSPSCLNVVALNEARGLCLFCFTKHLQQIAGTNCRDYRLYQWEENRCSLWVGTEYSKVAKELLFKRLPKRYVAICQGRCHIWMIAQ